MAPSGIGSPGFAPVVPLHGEAVAPDVDAEVPVGRAGRVRMSSRPWSSVVRHSSRKAIQTRTLAFGTGWPVSAATTWRRKTLPGAALGPGPSVRPGGPRPRPPMPRGAGEPGGADEPDGDEAEGRDRQPRRPARQATRGAPAPVDPGQPPGQPGRPGHRQPERRAGPPDQARRDREQRGAVGRRAPHLVDAEVVARPLAGLRRRPREQPGQRVDPIEGDGQPLEHVPGVIAAPDVGQFVQQDRVGVPGRVEGRRGGRQQDRSAAASRRRPARPRRPTRRARPRRRSRAAPASAPATRTTPGRPRRPPRAGAGPPRPGRPPAGPTRRRPRGRTRRPPPASRPPPGRGRPAASRRRRHGATAVDGPESTSTCPHARPRRFRRRGPPSPTPAVPPRPAARPVDRGIGATGGRRPVAGPRRAPAGRRPRAAAAPHRQGKRQQPEQPGVGDGRRDRRPPPRRRPHHDQYRGQQHRGLPRQAEGQARGASSGPREHVHGVSPFLRRLLGAAGAPTGGGCRAARG